MEKYLEVPAYYDDLKINIYNKILLEVLCQDDLLAYLREVYQNDHVLFYNIRDELLMRGIVFKKQYQNNFFPGLPYQIQHVINKRYDNKDYLRINNVTGIQAIINRYKVESDLFFHNMPLEGISHYLKKETFLLAKQFESAGFSIVPIENYTDGTNGKSSKINEFKVNIDFTLIEAEKEQNVIDADNKLIQEYFDGREYLAFHRYCAEHDKKNLSDLTVDFMENFRHVKGVGVSKYKTAMNRFEELGGLKSDVKIEKKINAIEYFTCNPLKDILERKGVDYLTFVDTIYYAKKAEDLYNPVPIQIFEKKSVYIKELVDELRHEEELQRFKELQESIRKHPTYDFLLGMKISSIRRILGLPIVDEEDENIHLFEMVENIDYKVDLMKIESSLSNFKTPSMYLKKIEKILTEREWEIVIERLDKTLQEVGDLVGLTRERVRQIEGRAREKLKKKAKKLHLDLYFNYYLQNNLTMTIDEFMEKLQIDIGFKEIFLLLIDNEGSFERKDANLINKQIYSHALGVQNSIADEGESIIEATSVLRKFNENSDYEFPIEIIDYFMEELKYRRKNGLYFKRTIKLPAQIGYLFMNKIHGPIEMTDENFEYLQLLMSEVFDDRFESGKRPAIERIRSTKNVILVDSNTFMYQDIDNVSEKLLNDIEESIETELRKAPMITAYSLYQEYIQVWKKYNLLSHYHLYSILQYHFDGTYSIGKGNTLAIFKSFNDKADSEGILVNYLEKNGGVQAKKHVLHDLKWQPYKLEQLISRSRKVIPVIEEGIEGYGIKLISAFNFDVSDIYKIKKFMESFLVEDYIFTADLLFEMEFEDELSEILAKANITETYSLGSLLKWIDKDLRGYQHLLYKKESDIDTIEKVLIQTFPNLVRRDEIEKFLTEKGYSQSTVFSVINTLLENESFYVYTSYQYINAHQLQFTEEVKVSLREYLEKSFGDKLYLSALELTGYSTDILPITANGWQPQLITEFAKYVGYIHIKTSSDYRYNKWILVRKDLGLNTYEELVHYVVKNEYNGNFHERDLASFLVAKKLSHSPYQLSLELKTSKYFEMKDLEFVEVKEW